MANLDTSFLRPIEARLADPRTDALVAVAAGAPSDAFKRPVAPCP